MSKCSRVITKKNKIVSTTVWVCWKGYERNKKKSQLTNNYKSIIVNTILLHFHFIRFRNQILNVLVKWVYIPIPKPK